MIWQIKSREKSTQTRLPVAEENRQPLFMAACNCNAMPKLRYSLLGNQHAIPLLGFVQITNLLVVLIDKANKNSRLCGENQKVLVSEKNFLYYHYFESANTQESMGGCLAHTSWECTYHIVFVRKFRRQIIHGKLKMEIEKV